MSPMYASRAWHLRNLAFLVSAWPLFVSCSVTPPGQINEIYREVLEARHDRYRLKEGDILTIRLYSPQHQDLALDQVRVRPDGRTDFFFMDDAHVAGKTLAELEVELRARLEQEVREPEISIQVEPLGEKVHMVGDFERPGEVDLTTRMTLHEAIAVVGGMRVTGDTDWAELRRPCINPRHPDRYRIDLNDDSEELFLLPGDQIVLGKNGFGTVVHYIQIFITSIFPNPYYLLYTMGGL